jgi:molybdenum-dependent DNA-binding transcriptional regulator ModE
MGILTDMESGIILKFFQHIIHKHGSIIHCALQNFTLSYIHAWCLWFEKSKLIFSIAESIVRILLQRDRRKKEKLTEHTLEGNGKTAIRFYEADKEEIWKT